MFKIGIIGCGKIAQVRHIPEYADHTQAELAGYYDLNTELSLIHIYTSILLIIVFFVLLLYNCGRL